MGAAGARARAGQRLTGARRHEQDGCPKRLDVVSKNKSAKPPAVVQSQALSEYKTLCHQQQMQKYYSAAVYDAGQQQQHYESPIHEKGAGEW